MQKVSSTPCVADTVLKLTRNHAVASVTAQSVSHASGCGVSAASTAARTSTSAPTLTTTYRYASSARDDDEELDVLATIVSARIVRRQRVAPHDGVVVADVGVAPHDRLAIGVVNRVAPHDRLAVGPAGDFAVEQ